MKAQFPLAVLAASAAFLGGPSHAATPLVASMSLEAKATIGDVSVVKTAGDAWGTVLGSLSIAAQALNNDAVGNLVTAQGYGSASWASANAGGVSFEGYGWDWSAASPVSGSPLFQTNLNTAGPDWRYTFTAEAGDEQFRVNYNVSATGYIFGLQGWDIVVTGGPEGDRSANIRNIFDPTASGTFVAGLTAGNDYTVTLVNNGNLSTDTGFGLSGQMSGTFAWEIAPVPEPSTYALMALGLLAVGAAARRSRC